MSTPPLSNEVLVWALGIVGTLVTIFLGLFAFLFKFTINGFAKKQDEISVEIAKKQEETKAEIKESNDAQFAKISKVEDSVGKIAEAASETKVARAITDLRVGHLEAAFENFRLKNDDMEKFLQGLGFRKRDGIPP